MCLEDGAWEEGAGSLLGLSPSLPAAGWLRLMIDRKGCPGRLGSWLCALLPPGSPCPACSQSFNHVWLDRLELYLSSEGEGARGEQPGSLPPACCLPGSSPQAGLLGRK